VTTVSNLLNGRTDAMTEETRQRVQDTIVRLNYRPSRVARSLVTRRTATLGLILSEIETPLFLQSVNIIEPIARTAGYNTLFCNARSSEDEQQVVTLLLDKQVDGIIFLSNSNYRDADHLSRLPASAPPIVLVNRTTHLTRFDHILWDNTGGAAEAIDHLVRLGHTRIAHLHGPLNRRSTAERVEGFKQGLARNGLEFNPAYLCSGDFTGPPEVWERSTLDLLDLPQPPTAILAADDIVAAIVIRTLQRAGLNLPRDMAVVGIDDQPVISSYINPRLTTVRLPVTEAGQLAIEMLLNRIAGLRTEIERVILPCPLIVRDSCGASLVQGIR
jgi:LacI family transcriptional regulator